MAMFSRISNLFALGTPGKQSAEDSSPHLVGEELADSPMQSRNHNKDVTDVVQMISRLSHVGKDNSLHASTQLGKTFTPSRRPLYKPTSRSDSTARHERMDALIKHRGSMSPNTRVDFLLGKPGYQTPQAAGTKRKRDNHVLGASSGKKFKAIAEEDDDDDLDGSTILVTNDPYEDRLSESERQIQRETSEAWDDIDQTLVDNHESLENSLSSSFQQPLEAEAESNSLFISTSQLLVLGWPADTTILVQKLYHRGREPILPSHWKMDFHYLPDALFSTANTSIGAGDRRAFIGSLGALPDAHGTKAMSLLFQLPGKARDKSYMRLETKDLIESGIKTYIFWAYKDAGLPAPSSRQRQNSYSAPTLHMPRLILTHTAPYTEDVNVLEGKVIKRLTALRQRWTTYLSSNALGHEKDIPTVYAIVISHTIVAIVTFSERGLRQLGHFDLGDRDLDVWNALALAALGVHGRNIACDYSFLEQSLKVGDRSSTGDLGQREWSEDPDL